MAMSRWDYALIALYVAGTSLVIWGTLELLDYCWGRVPAC